jgi:hypothetical protein
MSSAEDGYCSSDSPRAESPDEPLLPAAVADADAESPRAAGSGMNKRERDLSDLPASPSSPLPPAKRRYGQDSCVVSHHACLRSEYSARRAPVTLLLRWYGNLEIRAASKDG